MIEEIKKLIIKYKEVLLYLIFGGLTTVVNYVVYWLFYDVLGVTAWDSLLANSIAWVAAVIFAFITNKLFVFESRATDVKTVAYELATFTAARLLSLGVESLTIWLGFGVLGLWQWGVKIAASVLVIIINYIASKLVIFKKKKPDEENKAN